jgi:hypothetical protein
MEYHAKTSTIPKNSKLEIFYDINQNTGAR